MRGKVVDGVIDFKLQDFTRVLVRPGHVQRILIESLAVAGITENLHVWQEAHFDGTQTLPFAHGASALASIEREPCSGPAAYTCVACLSKQFAYVVPEADIGGRAGPWGLANGGLVHLQDPIDRLPAFDGYTPLPCRRSAG